MGIPGDLTNLGVPGNLSIPKNPNNLGNLVLMGRGNLRNRASPKPDQQNFQMRSKMEFFQWVYKIQIIKFVRIPTMFVRWVYKLPVVEVIQQAHRTLIIKFVQQAYRIPIMFAQRVHRIPIIEFAQQGHKIPIINGAQRAQGIRVIECEQ